MNNITISLKNELYYYLKLYHLLDIIYLYFDNIYIVTTEKYKLINNIIFYNLYNVKFIEKSSNSIFYKEDIEFLKELEINNYVLNLKNESKIFRDLNQENTYYSKLIDKVNDNYIFYCNSNENFSIINYFGKKYIYNPFYNFYEIDHKYYNNWVKLNTSYMIFFYKIILNADELHIFDIDMLYLILEIDTNNISKKYFYYHDLLIKEKEYRLKDWHIIVIN